jgi:hypothetical protein
MSSASENQLRDGKSARASTMESGSAVWSSTHIPDEQDPYEVSKSVRSNYSYIGDAYDRSQAIADQWEINDR